MKRLSVWFLSLVVLAGLQTTALAQGVSVAGTWDMVVESPQGKRPSTLVIKQEGDKLSAVVKGARGERPLDSVSLKGDEITMVMTVQFQGQDMVITYVSQNYANTSGTYLRPNSLLQGRIIGWGARVAW